MTISSFQSPFARRPCRHHASVFDVCVSLVPVDGKFSPLHLLLFWFPPMVKPPRSMNVDLTVSLTSGMCEDKQVVNDVLNALHVVFLLKETKRN